MKISIQTPPPIKNLEEYLILNVKDQVLNWEQSKDFPTKTYSELFDLGLFSAPLPKAYGGGEASMIELMEVAKQLGQYSPGIFSTWIGNMLSQTALMLFAPEPLAKSVLKQTLEKHEFMSFCVTEKESGTDIARMVTTAEPVNDGYVINGEKYFITNANVAKHYLVFARTPDQKLTAFYVPKGTDGVSVGEPLKKLGQNESNTGQLSFNQVYVPQEHILGEVGKGFDIIISALSRTRTLIAGASCGICERSMSEAKDYLTNSIRYKKPLIEKRELQSILSELKIKTEAAWLLGCKSAHIWDSRKHSLRESSIAKYYAADLAVKTVNECLELCGGYGYLENNILSKFYRDAKLFEIYEGASMVHIAMINKEDFSISATNRKKDVAA